MSKQKPKQNNNCNTNTNSRSQNQKSKNNNNKSKYRGSDMRPDSSGFKVEREEPGKDSRSKRINLPNERTSKFARNFVKDMEDGTKRGNNNDISTWNKNQELMKSAGNIPFASIVGEPFHPISTKSAAVPGIIVFKYSHSIGSSQDPIAVNKCFEAMYSYMVHANSRDYSYDYPDLAMYCMAAADVYSAIEEAKRIYGLYKAYEEPNRYLVDPLIQALGWDPKHTRRQLSHMWNEINDLILQTRQLWIPNTIPVMSRWVDLNAHVYKDADSKRAQMYVMRQVNYWQLEEVAMDSGTSLMPALIPTTNVDTEPINWQQFCSYASPITWPQFREMIQNMINKLVASQDRGAIFGDILKAYGGDKIIAMPEFTSDYAVFPEVNAMVLAQFENCTHTLMMQKAVVQNPNGDLSIKPIFNMYGFPFIDAMTQKWLNTNASSANANTFGQPASQILNFHGPGQPTPEWVMEATRFKSNSVTFMQDNAVTMPTLQDIGTVRPVYEGGHVLSNFDSAMVLSAASTEIIHEMKIYTRENTGQGWELGNTTLVQYVGSDVLTTAALKAMKRLMAFDWHPFIYDVDFEWENENSLALPLSDFTDAYGDFDNYIVISDAEMSKLHTAAVYSAFGVPLNLN